MKVYFVIFTCFQLTRMSVFEVVLPAIPEDWKQLPKQTPTKYNKRFDKKHYNNFMYPYVSRYNLPITNTHNHHQTAPTQPEMNIAPFLPYHIHPMSALFPQNEHIHSHISTPQLTTQLVKPSMEPVIDSQNKQKQAIVAFPENNEDSIFVKNIIPQNEIKTDNKYENNDNSRLRTAELFNTVNKSNNNISTIPEAVRSEKLKKDNKSVNLSNGGKILVYLRPENKEKNHSLEDENRAKPQSNKTLQKNENYKGGIDEKLIQYPNVTTNNFTTYQSDNDSEKSKTPDDLTERKSDIEIIINNDTKDPGTNIVIQSQDYQEVVRTPKYEIPDLIHQDQQEFPISSSLESNQDNGTVVTDQYMNTMPDTISHANVYQTETDTEGDKKSNIDVPEYDNPDSPDSENVNLNEDSSNYPNEKLWRSLKNTNITIKNNPRNIKLYFNYGKPANKDLNQRYIINSKDYKNINDLKLYHPRQKNIINK